MNSHSKLDQSAIRIGYTLSQQSLDRLKQVGLPPEIYKRLAKVAQHEDGFASGNLFKSASEFLSRILEEVPLDKTRQKMLWEYAEPAFEYDWNGQDDFTFYLERNESDDQVKRVLDYYQPQVKPGASYECKLRLWHENEKRSVTGRCLACLSNEGRYWSITFRVKEKYSPKKEEEKDKDKGPFYLFETSHTWELLYGLIFGKPTKEKHGLVVIAGRTGSSKSQIASGLLKKYLEFWEREGRKKAKEQKSTERQGTTITVAPRPPHLLTYEDPIEKYLYKISNGTFYEEKKFKRGQIPKRLAYTPRQKERDVSGLEQAVNDALRQTPKVMLVGETRGQADWKQLVHFAGTGHLVITTTHAGSLTEAMSNILQAIEAQKPEARSILADRLLAVIHLRGASIEGVSNPVLLPALWRHTPEGAKALMAEGLSSLLPKTPHKLPTPASTLPNCIGRYWFTRELLKTVDWQAIKKLSLSKEEVERAVRTSAFEFDLEGI